MANQNKNGISQFLSCRCTTTEAIHQLQRVSVRSSATLGNSEKIEKHTR